MVRLEAAASIIRPLVRSHKLAFINVFETSYSRLQWPENCVWVP